MSYINLSLTTRFADPAKTVQTLHAGFSREGGRPELVETGVSSTGVLPPIKRSIPLTPDVTSAASALLEAAQGANWVQDIEVSHSLVREPATVTWTQRHGSGGSGFMGQLPANIQAVVDAASALDTLARYAH